MKKQFCLILFLLTAAFSLSVSAREFPVYEKEQDPVLPELKQACEVFLKDTEGILTFVPKTVLYEQAYPVVFTKGLLATEYEKAGSLLDLGNGTAQWRIPVTFEDGTSGEIRLTEGQTGWTVAGVLKNDNEKDVSVTAEMLRKALQTAPETAGAESMLVYADANYSAILAVAAVGGKEYVASFSRTLEKAGIPSGTVFSAENFIEKLKYCFDEKAVLDNPGLYKGVPQRASLANETVPEPAAPGSDPQPQEESGSQSGNGLLITSLAGGLVFVGIVVFFLLYKRRKTAPEA